MRVYQRTYREKNREKIKARDRAFYAANKALRGEYENTPARRARQAANKRRRYKTDRAIMLARVAAYQIQNRDARQLLRERRRATKAAAEIKVITPRDWSRLLNRHGHRCAYCGEQEPLTQDHVIPLAKGGRHSIGNLLPACVSCNSSKRDRLLVEWRYTQGVDR